MQEEVTDDMLMALADGELDAATAERLQRLVADDPALRRRLALFQDSAAALKSAMDPGPVPDRFVQMILSAPVGHSADIPAGNVVPLRPRAVSAGWRTGLAAAMLALAFGLGGYLLGRQAPGMAEDPARFAGIAATMATGESVDLAGGAQLRVLGSYETGLGLCRMLAVEAGDHVARQVICRQGDGWQVALQVERPAAAGFVPASDTMVETVDLYLDGIGAGPALDVGAEQAALTQP